jgi:hypothetical protein
MTAIYGMKIGQEKHTWIDPNAKAIGVIYDPDLTARIGLFRSRSDCGRDRRQGLGQSSASNGGRYQGVAARRLEGSSSIPFW